MTTTDIIAFAALIIASVSFVFNYLYTKRTFEHTFYPILQVLMKCDSSIHYESLYQTYLTVDVQNTGNRAIENIEIHAKISDKKRAWKLWKPKWMSYARLKIPTLDSRKGRTEVIRSIEYTSVEEFIKQHWSDMIKKELTEPDPPFRKYSQWYKLEDAITLDVLLTVKYDVARHLRHFTAAYRLTPKLTGLRLEGWSCERVTGRM